MCIMIIGGTIIFLTGFFLCYFVWPRHIKVEVEKVVEKQVTVSLPVVKEKALSKDELEARVQRYATTRLMNLLQSPENWKGVLEVKDNEAQTVRYKRAALASSQGFADLKNDSYWVYGYSVHKDVGCGICFDGQSNLFIFRWYPGVTKVPIDIKTIRIIQGRRVEASSSLP